MIPVFIQQNGRALQNIVGLLPGMLNVLRVTINTTRKLRLRYVGKRVAIVGSRTWTDRDKVIEYVMGLPSNTIVVSGGARGVDRWAEQAARDRGLEVEVYRPDWTSGRGAGMARNQIIVDRSDRVVAFWDGESRGTRDTILKTKRAGKPLKIINPECTFVLKP